MIYQVNDPAKVCKLFDGWQETMIWSCLQKVMGKIYVPDLLQPKSACAHVGCFAFYAGEPNAELLLQKPAGFLIMVPQNDLWSSMIETCFPDAKRVIRYAIRKDTVFDTAALHQEVSRLPEGYVLKKIDSAIYDLCLKDPVTADYVFSFDSKEQFLSVGRGMVILKAGRIVAGASSYTRYLEGIEIEVDTVPEERRKHLATVACSALILACLQEGLYPSWDAQNMDSVHLAQKLGYQPDHSYPAYEVASEHRTH